MIVFLNLDGTARIVSPERVFQGSSVNIVSAIYAGAPNTSLQIAFTLPNRVVTQYAPMSYNVASQEGIAGVWEYKIPSTVTEKTGTVGMTICATLPDGKQTSYNLTFNVEYAVLPQLPPEPDQNVYDLILQYLAENQSRIVNLDTRVTDLENKVVAKTLLDITATVENGETVFTKYYTDGTTAQFSVPLGDGGVTTVNGNTIIKFDASQWRDTGTNEEPSGIYEIAFGPQQTGQISADFISELAIVDNNTYESGTDVVPTAKNGYSTLAQKVFKGSDGSVLLTDVLVPFTGQLVLFGGVSVVAKTLLDITAKVEEEETVFTKYYTDGTTAQFSIPTGGGSAATVNGNIIIRFGTEQWIESQGKYEIAFGPQQTGQANADFMSELSMADNYAYQSGLDTSPTEKSGYSTLAQKIFKGSDGSVLLTDVQVPFDGQLILFGGVYSGADNLTPYIQQLTAADWRDVGGVYQARIPVDQHNKGFAPSVTVINLSGNEVVGCVVKIDGKGNVTLLSNVNDDLKVVIKI